MPTHLAGIASTLPEELRPANPTEIEQYAAEFEALHARFSVRSEPREYLRGLLALAPRKNCWQMAEATGAGDAQ